MDIQRNFWDWDILCRPCADNNFGKLLFIMSFLHLASLISAYATTRIHFKYVYLFTIRTTRTSFTVQQLWNSSILNTHPFSFSEHRELVPHIFYIIFKFHVIFKTNPHYKINRVNFITEQKLKSRSIYVLSFTN